MIRDLLEETIEELTVRGKSPDDVLWVGDNTTICSWEAFSVLARGYQYYAGYGSQEVNRHLVVAGDTWWLERKEYDGSECWMYKEKPTDKNKKEGTLNLNEYKRRNAEYVEATDD
jgi:hypothetical protein